MIYGEPIYTIDDDQTDRVGLRTTVLSLMWGAKSNLPLDVLSSRPSPPPTPGGVLLLGSQTRRNGGAMRTLWIFQGIDGDGRNTTFRTRQNTNDFGFAPGFAQVGIELSPRFEQLFERYGGYYDDGQLQWPRTVGGSSATSGLSAAKKEKVNEMFGHTEFLRMEGTYSCRYLAFDVAAAFSGVEKIHNTAALPGRAPAVADRNWLKLPPAYERRGPVFEIVEEYWLSGPGGWPKPIYGELGSSGAGTSGLQTGGLEGASLL